MPRIKKHPIKNPRHLHFSDDFPPVEDDRGVLRRWFGHETPMAAFGFTIRVSCLLQLTAFFSRDTTGNATFIHLII
ncbi:hypothetical protein Hanom_Chr08g00737701 [Helianthus anomalus]